MNIFLEKKSQTVRSSHATSLHALFPAALQFWEVAKNFWEQNTSPSPTVPKSGSKTLPPHHIWAHL